MRFDQMSVNRIEKVESSIRSQRGCAGLAQTPQSCRDIILREIAIFSDWFGVFAGVVGRIWGKEQWPTASGRLVIHAVSN